MSDDGIAYLLSLEQFGIKFGLENMRAMVARLGHPERAFQSIHIAGTNGKGSVTAMVDAALRAAGYRSGRYTSPHLVDLTERFVIDGRAVSRPELVAAVDRVRAAVDALREDGSLQVQPTFFEVTTAVAFDLFRRAQVDVAVIEVGLGGRLDATNVVSPLATAITSIARDHEQYLGTSLADIAAEKAGIIKPGVPVVVDDAAEEAMAVIERIARERHTEVIRASDGVSIRRRTGPPQKADAAADHPVIGLRTPARDYGDVALSLRGDHQVANAVVAVRLLEVLNARGLRVSPAAIVDGLTRTSWPGRLDIRRLPAGREAILDAAHNPAGARALATYLHERAGGRLPLVFAAMRDKDIREMLRALLPEVSTLIATRASHPRSADPATLGDQARALAPDLAVRVEPAIADALAAAWTVSRQIVVAGSIFLLGDVMGEWGIRIG